MSTQGSLADLDRVLVSLPDWQYSVLAALALGGVSGIPVFESAVLPGVLEGIAYVGLPTVVAAVVTYWLDRLGGGDLSLNRSTTLALVCEGIVLALWFAAWLVAGAVGQSFIVTDTVLSALAFIVGVRVLVLSTVSRHSRAWTIGMAGTQSILALVLPAVVVLAGARGWPVPAHLPSLVVDAAAMRHHGGGVLLGLSALYVGSVYAILRVVDRPVRQSLEVTSLDFAHGMFRYLSGQPRFLESFFEEFGDDVQVPVSAVAFHRDDGSEKARVVVPAVHPGPMGDVGGGRLPEKLERATEGVCFPLHGMAGHDFNPVSQTSVDSIVDAVDDALDGPPEATAATRAVRVGFEDVSVVGQRFGATTLAASTFAPEPADDVDFGVGLASGRELESEGGAVLLADAHNSNDGTEGTGGFRHVTAGSARANALVTAAERGHAALDRAATGAVELGVAAADTAWGPADGVGPLGVRVAVIDVDGHRTAYVLVDGNNAEIGLRDHLRGAALERVDEAELLTTDTHVVTQTSAVNQLGRSIDWDELRALVRGLVEEAIADAEPVAVVGGETKATVRVFGHGRTEQFASLANAMVVVGLFLFGIALVTAVAVNVLVFALVP